MQHFETLTEAMEDLRERGYTHDFKPKRDYLEESGSGLKLKSEEFNVDEFHRFEGTSDPGDEMTLYAISTADGKKGVFVSAQGTYANEVTAELMQKFSISERPETNTEGSVQPIHAIGLDANQQ
ncbi:hypothetical protein ACFQ4C_06085 [Larkinella insperata]|uniref:Phosphoribosylpyrophosphate synthetase n=1 Tax=Larkinella insperata TaxID=332158 RepID=A0ABW3QBP4_9BACT|nr:hypothetical protein [Larkinella insperata]